jgi:hypothetical protein
MIRTHVGMSLDGFLTSKTGLPAWDFMPRFGPGTHGYTEFMTNLGAVAMGRTSFEQGLDDWLTGRPWDDRPVFVVTSRPLPENAPPTVVASQGGPQGWRTRFEARTLMGCPTARRRKHDTSVPRHRCTGPPRYRRAADPAT